MKKILYRVKEGDTLISVCANFNVPPLTVIEENMLETDICAGDMLVISVKEKVYFVKPFDTFCSISKKFNVPEEVLEKLNKTPYLFYGLTIRID